MMPTPATEPHTPRPEPEAVKRILLVSVDEPLVRLLDNEMAAFATWAMRWERDAEQARAVFRRERPDLLILGEVLDQGDSLAFLSEVVLPAAPRPPVLFLARSPTAPPPMDVLERVEAKVLYRPLAVGEVLKSVEAALGLSDNGLALARGLDELKESLQVDLPSRIAALHRAHQTQDAPRLRHLAQRLAGAAGMFGMEQVGEAATRLEAALTRAQTSPESIDHLLSNVAEAALERPEAGARKALFVGDDDLVNRAVRAAGEFVGLQLSTAQTVAEARDQLSAAHWSLVIAERDVEEFDDGLQLLKTIATQGQGRPHSILLSARDDLRARREALGVADTFVAKKSGVAALCGAIKRALICRANDCVPVAVCEDKQEAVVDLLQSFGWQPSRVDTGEQLWSKLSSAPAAIVVCECFGDGSGHQLARLVRADSEFSQTPLCLLPASVQPEQARAKLAEHLAVWQSARADSVFEDDTRSRGSKSAHHEESTDRFGLMVGRSVGMRAVFRQIGMVANTDAQVCVQGESGTGKELVAHMLHELSGRSRGPFVPINCAAIPDNLLESELFGYVKGAFTGADKNTSGLLESANGGTLFLDEIEAVSPKVQIKLLRVLEQRELLPVGGREPVPLDFRLVTATNEDLATLIENKRLREDFFYRIGAFKIVLPPLRERPEDVVVLAKHFLSESCATSHATEKTFHQNALRCLLRHPWPGNVRELRNAVEYALVSSAGPVITEAALPVELRADHAFAESNAQPADEAAKIRAALEATGGVRTKAAELLGVSRVTLWKRMRKYGLSA